MLRFMPCGKSCSAHAAKLIASGIKKEFCANYISVYKNCGTRNRYTSYAASKITSLYKQRQISAQHTFDETDILPIEFSCSMAFCDTPQHVETVPKLHRINLHYFWHLQSCILLHFAARHRVDADEHSFLAFFRLSAILEERPAGFTFFSSPPMTRLSCHHSCQVIMLFHHIQIHNPVTVTNEIQQSITVRIVTDWIFNPQE